MVAGMLIQRRGETFGGSLLRGGWQCVCGCVGGVVSFVLPLLSLLSLLLSVSFSCGVRLTLPSSFYLYFFYLYISHPPSSPLTTPDHQPSSPPLPSPADLIDYIISIDASTCRKITLHNIQFSHSLHLLLLLLLLLLVVLLLFLLLLLLLLLLLDFFC